MSSRDELGCGSVLAVVWTFLDDECTDETCEALCKHLEWCTSCRGHYEHEARIKKLIATKCAGDRAPQWLRWLL
jgi:mycothiol system anti-sigma-R factor